MNAHEHSERSPEATRPQESPSRDGAAAGWEADIAQTLKLGEQMMGFAGGVVDLARTEALLAVNTLPKLMMLWLLMMPIILLTWCAFSVLVAWSIVALSEQLGLGLLAFFLLQILLLFVCRWLFVKYRTRMTLPHTREQINNFMRSAKNEFERRSKVQE